VQPGERIPYMSVRVDIERCIHRRSCRLVG
jgi:hypothetical protein